MKDTLWSLGSALEYCILMCQIGLQVNVSTELIIPVIKKFEKYWPHVDLGELLSLLLQNAKLLINQGLITQALSFCELVTDLHQKSTFYKGNESNFKTIQM